MSKTYTFKVEITDNRGSRWTPGNVRNVFRNAYPNSFDARDFTVTVNGESPFDLSTMGDRQFRFSDADHVNTFVGKVVGDRFVYLNDRLENPHIATRDAGSAAELFASGYWNVIEDD